MTTDAATGGVLARLGLEGGAGRGLPFTLYVDQTLPVVIESQGEHIYLCAGIRELEAADQRVSGAFRRGITIAFLPASSLTMLSFLLFDGAARGSIFSAKPIGENRDDQTTQEQANLRATNFATARYPTSSQTPSWTQRGSLYPVPRRS